MVGTYLSNCSLGATRDGRTPYPPHICLEPSNVLFDLVAWMRLPLVGALSFFLNIFAFFIAIYMCVPKKLVCNDLSIGFSYMCHCEWRICFLAEIILISQVYVHFWI